MALRGEFVIEVERLRDFCLQMLRQVGVEGAEAECCAESLLYASLRGVDSHGVAMLPIHIERVRSGQIQPGRELRTVQEGPVTALCDGGQGMGPFLCRAAMEMARDKARTSGLAAVSLVDGNYAGGLAFYVEPVAREGLLALCVANATPRVAPFGGSEGLHGTNPLAYAAPVAGGEPIVFDAATGHSAAKVLQALDEGRTLDEGVLLDQQGRATVDPADLQGGALLPVGGALGYGLGMLVDLLAGGLGGGPCGPDVPNVNAIEGPYGCGFFALVIDPERFAGMNIFAERGAFLSSSARDVPPAETADEVRVPGDRARAAKTRRSAQGIPFSGEGWEMLMDRLAACDIETGDWRGLA